LSVGTSRNAPQETFAVGVGLAQLGGKQTCEAAGSRGPNADVR